MPSVVNSDFEVKNHGSSQSLVSARSAEVKLPTLSLPIFLLFLATHARSITSSTTKRNVQRKVTGRVQRPVTMSFMGKQGTVKVLNSSELSVNAPVVSPAPIPGTSEPSENSRVVDVTSCISDVNPDVQILLCTALIQVRDIWCNYQTCRCLLDSRSQASLIK
ncbi:integrase catalytic domain-containing protein [Trichonephila clavipes]|nr:integrase catalytic domain-containing protein [Trichonephila clavipes]